MLSVELLTKPIIEGIFYQHIQSLFLDFTYNYDVVTYQKDKFCKISYSLCHQLLKLISPDTF